jgi:hypothetical protein
MVKKSRKSKKYLTPTTIITGYNIESSGKASTMKTRPGNYPAISTTPLKLSNTSTRSTTKNQYPGTKNYGK